MNITPIYQALHGSKFNEARKLIYEQLLKSPNSTVHLCFLARLEASCFNKKASITAAKKAIANGDLSAPILRSVLGPVLLEYHEPELLQSAYEIVLKRTPKDASLIKQYISDALLLGSVFMLTRAKFAENRLNESRNTALAMAFLMTVSYAKRPDQSLYPTLVSCIFQKFTPSDKNTHEVYLRALNLEGVQLCNYLLPLECQSLELHALLLDALTASESWQQLFDWCKKQLASLDSYNYYLGLNEAAVKLGIQNEARALHAQDTLNGLLASIDLDKRLGIQPNWETFWNKMGSKACAFEFLKDTDFVPEPSDDFYKEINRLKLVYRRNPSAIEIPKLMHLYFDNLDLLPVEKTDIFRGSDLMLIVVVKLLSDKPKWYRETAMCILNLVCAKDKHNFYARMLLVKVARSLGAFATALDHFSELEVRNFQLVSMGHLILTRMSSLYPDFRLNAMFECLYDTMDTYEDLQTALGNNVFTKLQGMLELQEKLDTSLPRHMFYIEKLKTERILKGSTSLGEVLRYPPKFSDHRDLSTRFDPQESDLDIDAGPRISERWVRLQILKEEAYLAALRSEKVDLPDVEQEDELTPAEKWAFKVIQTLDLDHPPWSCLEENDWQFFHTAHVCLETLKLITDIAKRRNMPAPPKAKEIRLQLKKMVKAAFDQNYTLETCIDIEGSEQTLQHLKRTRAKHIQELYNLC